MGTTSGQVGIRLHLAVFKLIVGAEAYNAKDKK